MVNDLCGQFRELCRFQRFHPVAGPQAEADERPAAAGQQSRTFCFASCARRDFVGQGEQIVVYGDAQPGQGAQSSFAEQASATMNFAVGQKRPCKAGAALAAVRQNRNPLRHAGPEWRQQSAQIGTQDDNCVVACGQLPEQPALAGPTFEAGFRQFNDAVNTVQTARQRQVDRVQQSDDFGLRQAQAQGTKNRRRSHEIANFSGLDDQNAAWLARPVAGRSPPQPRCREPGQQQIDHRSASASTLDTPAT